MDNNTDGAAQEHEFRKPTSAPRLLRDDGVGVLKEQVERIHKFLGRPGDLTHVARVVRVAHAPVGQGLALQVRERSIQDLLTHLEVQIEAEVRTPTGFYLGGPNRPSDAIAEGLLSEGWLICILSCARRSGVSVALPFSSRSIHDGSLTGKPHPGGRRQELTQGEVAVSGDEQSVRIGIEAERNEPSIAPTSLTLA